MVNVTFFDVTSNIGHMLCVELIKCTAKILRILVSALDQFWLKTFHQKYSKENFDDNLITFDQFLLLKFLYTTTIKNEISDKDLRF